MQTKKNSVIKVVTFLILVTFILFCGSCPPIRVIECFSIAYVTHDQHINSRYAKLSDYSTWSDGQFSSSVTAGKGVGLAIDQNKLLNIIMTDRGNSIDLFWGLGLSLWDESANSTPSAPPQSSPVGAFLGDHLVAIAFTRTDNTLFVGTYNTSQKRFANVVALQFGALNTNVFGRPSIVKYQDEILLTWRKNNGPYTAMQLVVAKGRVSQGLLSFSSPQVIPTPADIVNNVLEGFDSDPVITHAGSKYFIVGARENMGPVGLHGWDTQYFSSSDGVNWSSDGFILSSVLSVSGHGPHYGLAGATDGTLLLACITPNGDTSVAMLINGQWQGRSDINARIFTQRADAKPFVISGNKQ